MARAFGNGSGGGVGAVVGVGIVVTMPAVVMTGVWVVEPEPPEPTLWVPESFGKITKYTPAMTTRTATTAMITLVFFPEDAGAFAGEDGGGTSWMSATCTADRREDGGGGGTVGV